MILLSIIVAALWVIYMSLEFIPNDSDRESSYPIRVFIVSLICLSLIIAIRVNYNIKQEAEGVCPEYEQVDKNLYQKTQ